MMVCVEQEGRTALMLASWRGYLETVKELLRAGARTDTQDQVCVYTGRREVMCDSVYMCLYAVCRRGLLLLFWPHKMDIQKL